MDSFNSERIKQTAQNLNVPEVLRGDSSVREFLGLHVACSDFLDVLTRARQSSQPESGRTEAYPNIGIPIEKRYEVVVPLIEMTQAMVEEELHLKKLDPAFVKEKLSPALNLFGLFVADQPSHYDIEIKGLKVNSAYYERVHEYTQHYATVNSAVQKERMSQPVVFYRPKNSQDVILADYYAKFPNLQTFTTVLNGLTHLQVDSGGIGSTTPVEPGSYVSNDALQRERIGESLFFAKGILWEGIGTHINPGKVIKDLNYALDPYKLHVDIQPQDRGISEPDHEVSPDVKNKLEQWKKDQEQKPG